VTLRKIVGANIRAYRKEKGLTQEAVAFKAKLHENYISLVERGEATISLDNLEKIAKIIRIPVHLLLIQDSPRCIVTLTPKEG
jgi:transcriptional regulator with XRE-family HTH domain